MTLKLYHEPPFIVKGQLIDKEPPQAFRQAGVNLLQRRGMVRITISGKAVFLRSARIVTRVYGSIFWQAWLNKDNCRTYGLWLGIQTYDKRPTFSKDFHDFWTPARSFRIRELAAAIGAGNSTPALTGRFTDCAYCRKALEAGTPLTRCCGAHTPTRWKTLDQEEQAYRRHRGCLSSPHGQVVPVYRLWSGRPCHCRGYRVS